MIFPLKLGFYSFFSSSSTQAKPQGKRQADLEAECLLSESKNLPKALTRMRDCGAPIAPARHSKIHIGLSATRETKNGIKGKLSKKRMEHQPTNGKISQWFETFAAREKKIFQVLRSMEKAHNMALKAELLEKTISKSESSRRVHFENKPHTSHLIREKQLKRFPNLRPEKNHKLLFSSGRRLRKK